MSNEDKNAGPKDALYWCRAIVDLASGWDEDGALGPKEPLTWETVARMAMDYAQAALRHAAVIEQQRIKDADE
jgi:hypothetical protein